MQRFWLLCLTCISIAFIGSLSPCIVRLLGVWGDAHCRTNKKKKKVQCGLATNESRHNEANTTRAQKTRDLY